MLLSPPSSWNLVSTASLGIASHIIVTIEASDDAHGMFEFRAESLSVNGTEPEDGGGTVTLKVSNNGTTFDMTSPRTHAVQLARMWVNSSGLCFCSFVKNINIFMRIDVIVQ